MRFWLICLLTFFLSGPTLAENKPITLVVLGDSIAAGFGLTPDQALPARLETALKEKGHNVAVINAGVSGDTIKGGLARFDWVVQPDADGVIIELGGNDMLRGIDPEQSKKALFGILEKSKSRNLPVLLTGLRALRNFGEDYAVRFEAIYREAATAYDVILHEDLLREVAAEPRLNQPDGIHPTAAGVDVIVKGVLPKAEELIAVIENGRK